MKSHTMPTAAEQLKIEVLALIKEPDISYLKVIVEPSDPNIDIVAVHGLNPLPGIKGGSFAVNTWVGGESNDPKLWLKELLPQSFPRARVMIFAYNSNIAWSTSTSGVAGAADDLLARLIVQRRDVGERPILFLCHSLGGIVVKLAISKARSSPRYEDLYPAVRSIAFFATPHRGGLYATVGHIFSSAIRHGSRSPRSSIMETLRHDSHIAPEIQRFFEDCLSNQRLRICSFYEAKPIPPLTHLIVDQNSAILGLGFPREVLYRVQESNHSTICKFKSKDQTYDIIESHLADLIDYSLTDDDVKPWPDSMHPLSRPHSRSDLSLPNDINQHRRTSEYLQVSHHRNRSASPFGSREITRGDGPWITLPNFGMSRFLGREDILHSIKEIFGLETSNQNRLALYGLGGIGKTQIAMKMASMYRVSHPDDSVFWVRAANFDVFKVSLEEIARVCDLSNPRDDQNTVLRSVREHLLDKRNGGWLMIVDNADSCESHENPGRLSAKSANSNQSLRRIPISSMVPRCAHGRVLFTTNSKIVASHLIAPEGQLLEVPPMTSNESRELLEKYLADSSASNDSKPSGDDLEALARHLGNLPLAIAQAAAYMRQQSLTVAAYLELIAIDDESLSDLLRHDFQGYGTDHDFSKAIAATWKVAFDAIEKECPPAFELLSFIAFLEPRNIPKSLLKCLQPDERQLTAISMGTLQAYALVSYEPTSEICSVHRLLQLAMNGRLIEAGSLDTFATKALLILQKAFPDKTFSTPHIENTQSVGNNSILLPHALQVLNNDFTNIDETNIAASTLASNISHFYLQQGNFTGALGYSETAKSFMGKVAKPPQQLVLSNQATEVMALREADRLVEAAELANKVWLGSKKEFGSTAVTTIDSHLQLALIFRDLGQYKESLIITKDCVKVLEKNHKVNDRPLIIAKVRLGRTLFYVGEYVESEKMLREMLEVVSHELGSENIETLKIQHQIAFVMLALGRAAECETLCTETWLKQKSALGEYHPETLKTLNLKASAMREVGNFEGALRYHRKIYGKAVEVLGPEHRYTLMAGTSLADTLSDSSGGVSPASLAEAEILYNRRLNLISTSKEKPHPDFLRTQHGLANVFDLQGKHVDAEKLQQEVYSKLKAGLGKGHPVTLDALENLSRYLSHLGNTKDSTKRAIKLLDRREKALGWLHPETLRAARMIVELVPDSKKSRKIQHRLVFAVPREISSNLGGVEGGGSMLDGKEEGKGED